MAPWDGLMIVECEVAAKRAAYRAALLDVWAVALKCRDISDLIAEIKLMLEKERRS